MVSDTPTLDQYGQANWHYRAISLPVSGGTDLCTLRLVHVIVIDRRPRLTSDYKDEHRSPEHKGLLKKAPMRQAMSTFERSTMLETIRERVVHRSSVGSGLVLWPSVSGS